MTTDKEVQSEILRTLIDELKKEEWTPVLRADSIEDTVSQKLTNISEDDVRYHIKRLDENFNIDHTPAIGGNGTVELTARGIERYEELTDQEAIPTDHCTEILEILDNHERENPRSPKLQRDDIIDAVDQSESDVNVTIWYLTKGGFVDCLTSIGTPVWHSAEITRSGRAILERQG